MLIKMLFIVNEMVNRITVKISPNLKLTVCLS